MCDADNSCTPLHHALSPTWHSKLCYSEVTISMRPSIGCGRCNPTVLFLGSHNYRLLPGDFSDTWAWDILGILQNVQMCRELNIWGVCLSKQGWELTDKCFYLSSPKQTALTYFIRLLRMCHGLECQSPVWWPTWQYILEPAFVSFLFHMSCYGLLFLRIRCSSKLLAIQSLSQLFGKD